MARGRRAPKRGRVGRAPARKMARGGRTAPKALPRGRAMARGGRPAPRGRGRKMPGGGRTCGGMNQPPCPGGGGGYRKGGRTRPAPRGRQMAGGGRGRKFQAGGHSHGSYTTAPAGVNADAPGYQWHQHNINTLSGSLGEHESHHTHGSGTNFGMRREPGLTNIQKRRGGRVRHQLRRGGRPAPIGRRFQAGGQSVCPAGTDRTADGRCTPMGS